jgi:hypothetical protein
MANTDSRFAGSPTDAGRDISSLTFRVEAFAPGHLPLVARFSERYWSRPHTESYYRWRYLDSLPFSAMFVAVTETECLGLVCALRKRYLIAGEPTPCLEIFDWHSLPGLKGSGVGVRVMRALMREGPRLIGMGGTPDVLKALPAMGWQTIGQAVTFELPMTGETLEAGLSERMRFQIPGARLILNAATAVWFQPKARMFDGRAIQIAQVGDEVQELYAGQTGYDVVQVPEAAQLRWTTAGHPGTGGYRFWYFSVGGKLRGWALTRVYETTQGREAAILEVFAPAPDVQLYAWMVSEAAAGLSGVRPRVIRSRATCPILQAAFRANRFRIGSAIPVHTWPKMPDSDRRLHFTLNHSDAPFRPYPESGAATDFLI